MKKLSLDGKKALVTGASRGIGRAIAETLAAEGVHCVVTGRNKTSLEETVSHLKLCNVPAHSIIADLSEKTAPKKLVSKAAELLDGIDILINNAGFAHSAALEDTELEDWEKILNVNARAPYFICKYSLQYLRESNSGTIINIGSIVSTKGYEKQSAYTASKHALLGFTKSLAREVHEQDIRVHFISPGGVATDMVTQMRPDINQAELIQPQEIADTVVFLLGHRSNGVIDEINIRRESKMPWA